jgi:hypothetical protein
LAKGNTGKELWRSTDLAVISSIVDAGGGVAVSIVCSGCLFQGMSGLRKVAKQKMLGVGFEPPALRVLGWMNTG